MTFRSGLEERVADLMVELGVKYEYESTQVPYTIMHNYTPDFILPNGVLLECKGYWDDADRRKIRSVVQQHPETRFCVWYFNHPLTLLVRKSKNHLCKVV
jgi:hypothetical protein